MKFILKERKKSKEKLEVKRGRRIVVNKVYEKCCFCYVVFFKGRIYVNYFIKKYYLSFEKVKEFIGYFKYRL